jgi:hypothetical protein
VVYENTRLCSHFVGLGGCNKPLNSSPRNKTLIQRLLKTSRMKTLNSKLFYKSARTSISQVVAFVYCCSHAFVSCMPPRAVVYRSEKFIWAEGWKTGGGGGGIKSKRVVETTKNKDRTDVRKYE